MEARTLALGSFCAAEPDIGDEGGICAELVSGVEARIEIELPGLAMGCEPIAGLQLKLERNNYSRFLLHAPPPPLLHGRLRSIGPNELVQ